MNLCALVLWNIGTITTVAGYIYHFGLVSLHHVRVPGWLPGQIPLSDDPHQGHDLAHQIPVPPGAISACNDPQGPQSRNPLSQPARAPSMVANPTDSKPQPHRAPHAAARWKNRGGDAWAHWCRDKSGSLTSPQPATARRSQRKAPPWCRQAGQAYMTRPRSPSARRSGAAPHCEQAITSHAPPEHTDNQPAPCAAPPGRPGQWPAPGSAAPPSDRSSACAS